MCGRIAAGLGCCISISFSQCQAEPLSSGPGPALGPRSSFLSSLFPNRAGNHSYPGSQCCRSPSGADTALPSSSCSSGSASVRMNSAVTSCRVGPALSTARLIPAADEAPAALLIQHSTALETLREFPRETAWDAACRESCTPTASQGEESGFLLEENSRSFCNATDFQHSWDGGAEGKQPGQKNHLGIGSVAG